MPISWPAVAASFIPNIGGFAGGLITRKEVKTWYKTLKKPNWRPPNWAFAPIWTSLYTGMGYASYLVWKEGGGFEGPAKLPLALFATQLALNWAWTPIFFGMHNLKWGFYDLVLLDIAAAATAYEFYKMSDVAGYLFIPYMAWLGLATALNFNVWKNNPDNGDKVDAVKTD